MKQLCSIANQTIAFQDFKMEKVCTSKGNRIIGFYGATFDDLLVKPNFRKCSLIGESSLGSKGLNNTYDGNLGLIQQQKAFMYLKPEGPFFDEDWLRLSFPVYAERFIISEEISYLLNDEKIFNLLDNFEFEFELKILFFSTILTCLFVLSLIVYSKNGKSRFRKKLEKILDEILFNESANLKYNLSNLAIFLLFYELWLWFIILFLTNNIKTNKVVLDTSTLIKSEADIFKSNKTHCFMDGDFELTLALHNAPNGSLFKRIYDEKSTITKKIDGLNLKIGDKCVVEKKLENADLDRNKTIFMSSENTLNSMSNFFSSLRHGGHYWVSTKEFYSINFYFYYYNNKDLINYVERVSQEYSEAGIFTRFIRFLEHNRELAQLYNRFYGTVDEFLSENSHFEALNFENFENLFKIYFSICSIIFLFYLIDYSYHRWLKRIRISDLLY